ncbi:unnamed protein product, partial [Polarella glacialis]
MWHDGSKSLLSCQAMLPSLNGPPLISAQPIERLARTRGGSSWASSGGAWPSAPLRLRSSVSGAPSLPSGHQRAVAVCCAFAPLILAAQSRSRHVTEGSPERLRRKSPRRVAATGRSSAQAPVLVIGLDGVLCASAEEAAAAACAAAYSLWPSLMEMAEEIRLDEAGVRQSWVDYDWERFSAETTDQRGSARKIPVWLLKKLQQLRSACDTEWELVLLARLCVEEALSCRANRAKGRGGARPLTVGEVEANWTDLNSGFGLRESLLARWGTSPKELQEFLAEARSWRRSRINEPLPAAAPILRSDLRRGASSMSGPVAEAARSRFPFYLDVLELVIGAVAQGLVAESVHVITSRDESSAVAALQASSLAVQQASMLGGEVPDYQGSWAGKDGWRLIAGLRSAEDKAAAVESLLEEKRSGGANFLVVDDSVAFLRACAGKLSLGAATLRLAGWGYVSRG